MPRILGVTIPDNKKIEYALPYLYGIGHSASKVILRSAGVSADKRAKDLSADELNKIQKIIEASYQIEGELRREVLGNIKRLKEISCYRGSRHAKKLPVRGQRTKTNSRTVRGNVRKTTTSGRKTSTQKT